MMKLFAHLISWVFLPLLMPIYAVATALYVPSMEADFFQQDTLYFLNSNFKIVVLAWFIIFSFIAPALSLLILRYSKSISSIEIDNQKERGMPITISALFCLILGVLFLVKAPNGVLPAAVYALPWGGFAAIVLIGFINKKDKISLHGAGAGMLMGFFASYFYFQTDFYFEIIIVGVLVSGLVLSARIYLGKHTLNQVFKGFFVGFICVLLSILFFMYTAK